jgi:hypothetical protein
MTPDEFRELALDLEGVVERSHMGHPDFRANGKIFASLHSGDRFGMVKLAPEEQREFKRSHPEMFEPSSGAWGRQGYTNVRLGSADKATVRSALILAWENALAGPPPKKRRTPPARKASRPARRR